MPQLPLQLPMLQSEGGTLEGEHASRGRKALLPEMTQEVGEMTGLTTPREAPEYLST